MAFFRDVTGVIIDGDGAVYSVKQAFATPTVIGNTQVVAAVTDKKIRVLRYTLSAVGANNVKFQSATSDICPLHYMAATSTVNVMPDVHGHFETAVAAALNANLSAATAVGVLVTYIEVP